MPDHPIPRDDRGDHIDVDAPADVSAWAERLTVTPDQIVEAVQAVGDRAPDVELHLKGSRATTNADQEARAEPSAGSAPRQ